MATNRNKGARTMAIQTTNSYVEYVEMYRIENLAKGHFFDKGTMRFFNSRLAQYGYRGPEGTFFVTSERKGYENPRLYTVRQLTETGDVVTVGEFQAYKTGKTADKYARRYAEKGYQE